MKIALLSRWHPHSMKPDERYVREFLRHDGCEVVCVWDKNPQIAKDWGYEYGVPGETDLEKVLSRADVDGVLVTSSGADHREILIAAANHKKHIFTEKVLAFTMDDALAIREAVARSGVKFCIAFTRIAIKQLAYAKKLVEDGTLGTPVMFRCLCGHCGGLNGSLPDYWYDPDVCGGGAMIDLGFNSAYLARYIMGDVKSISSTFTNSILHKAVEDTASCNVIFANGAFGEIDATFASPLMSVFELSVYGTKGAYYTRFGGDSTTHLHLNDQPVEVLSADALPELTVSPVETWIRACTEGASDAIYGIDAAIDQVKFMIAAYASYRQNGLRIDL